MFDFAWSEIAVIGVVALVLIGPKDMPVAIKAVSDMIKKARRMAGEFQSHVDEMTKGTELAEVRQQINEIRNMDIRGEISRAVDADGSLRSALTDDPFKTASAPSPAMSETEVAAREEHAIPAPETPAETMQATPAAAPPEPPGLPEPPGPPPFIPPAFVPPAIAQTVPAQQNETHAGAAGD